MPAEADREGGKNRNPSVATRKIDEGGADRCAQLCYLHIDVQGSFFSF